jgi:hypothetical protein
MTLNRHTHCCTAAACPHGCASRAGGLLAAWLLPAGCHASQDTGCVLALTLFVTMPERLSGALL